MSRSRAQSGSASTSRSGRARTLTAMGRLFAGSSRLQWLRRDSAASLNAGESAAKRSDLTVAFVGLQLRENGKLYRVAPTATLSEAQERANALKARLRDRNVHEDVLAFCRAELPTRRTRPRTPSFEATKSVTRKD